MTVATAETAQEATAKDALVYAWPLYEMARMRAATSPLRIPEKGEAPDGQRWCNVFTHARKLLKAGTSRVVMPNNDTLYTNAWLDLSDGPLIMDVPDTHGRYYVLGFLDFFTNPFAHVGQRLTGTQARRFFITGPDFKGEVPEDFAAPGAHIVAPTNWVWIIGRILIDGEHDLDAVHALQDQFMVHAAEGGAQAPKPFDPQCNPKLPVSGAEFLTQVNQALLGNPAPAVDAPKLERFAQIGLGAGLTPSAAQCQLLDRVLPGVKQRLAAGDTNEPDDSSGAGQALQAWTKSPRILGSFGDQHFFRACIALRGIGMLESAEAIYPRAKTDSNGAALTGQHRYRLHFAAGELPPVHAFWSLTMYDNTDFMLVANPIDRYAIGDRTQGLMKNPDGSLTIHISHDMPVDATARANWLPAPAGEFYVCLRAYLPKDDMVDGRYQLPAFERLTV